MSRRVWMAGAALIAAIALSVALFATASSQNGPPDDRGRPPGVPASIQLTPDPLAIQCDGIDASTITVRVLDARGKPVPDGTAVYFDALYGFVDQVVTETKRGEATTNAHLYPYAANYPGLAEVDVSVGDLRASIGLDCAPPPPPCGPGASPPCPTPTPCNVPFSPPCPQPTPTCDPPFSPPTPFSPPCVTRVPGCGPDASPPCPTPTPSPSHTSVMFAVDADLTVDGIQATRPGSVPLGQNFTVDIILFGDVIEDYMTYQITLDYDDGLFDPVGLPVKWEDQPVTDVSGGTPLGTLIWPSGTLCDPSPTSNSITGEDDSAQATLSMACADFVFGELSSYQGVLLTLVFRCEQSGTGALNLHGIGDTFLLWFEGGGSDLYYKYNDGVANGSVTCGEGVTVPTATPTPAFSAGLDPIQIAVTPTTTPLPARRSR